MNVLAGIVAFVWIGLPIFSLLFMVYIGLRLSCEAIGLWVGGGNVKSTKTQPKHQRYMTITAKKDVLSFDIPTTKRQIKKLVQDNSLEIEIQGNGIHTDLHFGGSYETIKAIEGYVATGQLAKAIKVW